LTIGNDARKVSMTCQHKVEERQRPREGELMKYQKKGLKQDGKVREKKKGKGLSPEAKTRSGDAGIESPEKSSYGNERGSPPPAS